MKVKIIKTYIIPDVLDYIDGGLDDWSEQAESQLDEVKHFQYMQVDKIEECLHKNTVIGRANNGIGKDCTLASFCLDCKQFLDSPTSIIEGGKEQE